MVDWCKDIEKVSETGNSSEKIQKLVRFRRLKIGSNHQLNLRTKYSTTTNDKLNFYKRIKKV